MAQSLEMLVIWRILQGGAGAPLVPLSQSILFATFPRRQHTMVMSIFGMAVAVAPAFGPVFGGYLAEMHSWRWSFYMLVPIGICATIGMAGRCRPTTADEGSFRLDRLYRARDGACRRSARARARRPAGLVRFDRDRDRMPDRRVAFYIFLVHSLGARKPFVNLKLLSDRNYAIGLALVTIYGMLNFTPMVLLPPLLQQQAGYPDALVGQVIGCRGVGMLVGFMIAGFMSRIDPRISMAFGFGLQTAAGLWMLTFDLNVTMEILVVNSVIQGFAVGIVWVPITAVAFGTLEAKHYAEASAIFHLLRNIGSSFFISLSIAEIVRTSGANYSRMTEMITPYNRALTTPGLTGAWDFDTVPGLAKVAKEIARQSMMIGYLNAFTMYTVTSGLAVVFVLMVRGRKAGDVFRFPVKTVHREFWLDRY